MTHIDQRLTLDIADLSLTLLDDAPVASEWLRDRCASYHTKKTDAAASTTLAVRRNPDFVMGADMLVAELGDAPGSFWIRGVDFIARRRRCGLPVEVEAHPEAGMAGILRWVVSALLLEQGGLLLHSMSYSYEGSGIVCAGPSGRGKTTLARLLAQQVTLFTDETTAIQRVGDAVVAHATPFAGELGIVSGPASAMLDAIFLLRHAPQTQVRRLSAAEAVTQLLGCTFAPLRSGVWMNACLEAVEHLARSVPCYDLCFRPEVNVWETLQDACHRTVPAA